MKEVIENLLKALQGDPSGCLKKLFEISIEKTSDLVKFNTMIQDFLEHVTSEGIQNQMDCLLENIKSELKKDIDNNNVFVLEKLDEHLDKGMKTVEIPQEQRENLKNNLIACILTYIANKDIGFFNILTSKIVIEKELEETNGRVDRLEQKYESLLYMISRMREVLMVYHSEESPLRKPVNSLCVNSPERIIGREREILEIQKSFNDGSNVIFLSGRPGMGKTTLARKYANECDYRKIYFENYEHSIEYTITKLAKDKRMPGKRATTGEEILAYWENLNPKERESILLIIDNFNADTLQTGSEQQYTTEVKGQFFGRLKEIGIHVLITTRINIFSESSIGVGPVEKTIELFEKYYNAKLTDEQTIKVKELIEIVQENTMLIAQSANIWRKSDTARKYQLVEQLKNCQLKENDILLEEKTLYEQTKAMLDFSGICLDNEMHRVFAGVALMPFKGEHRDKFIEMSGCDINKLNDLIEGNWVLMDSRENISLHPVVKEIAIRDGLIDFENCNLICNYINDMLDLDLSLADRYPFVDCAWEIYKIFSSLDNLNDVLIRIFYRLSDICDNTGEHERSMEIVETINKNLDKVELDIIEKARILSGIAYSINNSFKNMDELNKATSLLQTAQKEVIKAPNDRKDDLDVKQTRVRIYSNMGSNGLAKSKCSQTETKNYLLDALKWHQKALKLRLHYLEDAEDRNVKSLKKEVAISYTTVATDYFYMEDYESAIKIHLKAYKIREELKEENAMCVSQQRIIGCLLKLYRKNLEINIDYLQIALKCYPILLETNYKYHNINALEININNFKEVYVIIQNDRRLERYVDWAKEKKQQIIKWMEGKKELIEIFRELIKDWK